MKFASPDKLKYRIRVLAYLKSRKDKFPVFNEFYESTVKIGTLPELLVALISMFDSHFEENLTIATCAARVEEVTILGKEHAEQFFAQVLDEMSISKTKH